MSPRERPEIDDEAHPRRASELFGHHEGEQALLDAYRSGRIPHAWLIAGAQGIGKATLAYRMARYVLAHPDPASATVQAATSLAVDAMHPVARHIAAGSHGGLLTLERMPNDKGVLRQVITIDESRETISFFGSTASGNGWRVCVVDTVDDLNPNAANALLKVLEEPPLRSLFLLVSHSPARLLPTIRSRCRKLSLRPLSPDDVARALVLATGEAAGDPALTEAAAAAEGSVARALSLMGGDALKLQKRVTAMLDQLPHLDPRQLHALGDALPLSDRVALTAFTDSIDRWIGRRLHGDAGQLNASLPRLARLAEVWDKIISAARDTESYNLERKPLVFSVFGLLAEATA